jgi:hypothetical protein
MGLDFALCLIDNESVALDWKKNKLKNESGNKFELCSIPSSKTRIPAQDHGHVVRALHSS